jgi:hypothetical protein
MTQAQIARRGLPALLASAVALVSLCCGSAFAHHSYSMFDSSRTATIEGVVAEFEWKNPHAHLWLYVASAKEPGAQELWSFENGSPLVLSRLGWSKDMPPAGERVSVEYWPLRNGEIGGHCRSVTLADGRRFDCPSDLGGVSPREAAARAAEEAVAATAAATPSTSYAALDALPAIAGWWFADPSSPAPRLAELLTPNAAAAMQAELARRRSGGQYDRGYCAPPTFAGLPLQGFELLLTPGRVTLATEAGLVRRLYLLDAPPPGSLDESTAGVSIARWEGEDLVVETTGLSSSATVTPGVALGHGVHVLERFSLVEPNVLEIVAEVTAPDIFSGPVSVTRRYWRDPNHVFTEFETCVTDDRAFDHATGLERFETTPPADLPPPPTN